jgi:hypothetical protein
MTKYQKACYKLALAKDEHKKTIALMELKQLIADVGKTEDTAHWKDGDYYNFAVNYIVSHDHNGIFTPLKNN